MKLPQYYRAITVPSLLLSGQQVKMIELREVSLLNHIKWLIWLNQLAITIHGGLCYTDWIYCKKTQRAIKKPTGPPVARL